MGKLADAVEIYRLWLDEDEQRGEVTFSVSCVVDHLVERQRENEFSELVD